MSVLAQLQEDLKKALKSGDEASVGLLRLLLAQIHNREIEKRSKGGGDVLSDEEVRDVLQKEVKKRKESITLFRQGKREDLAKKEEAEMALIAPYLPAAVTREEIEKVVDILKGSGFSDFPSLIREAMKQLKGRADGTLVSEVIRESLKP